MRGSRIRPVLNKLHGVFNKLHGMFNKEHGLDETNQWANTRDRSLPDFDLDFNIDIDLNIDSIAITKLPTRPPASPTSTRPDFDSRLDLCELPAHRPTTSTTLQAFDLATSAVSLPSLSTPNPRPPPSQARLDSPRLRLRLRLRPPRPQRQPRPPTYDYRPPARPTSPPSDLKPQADFDFDLILGGHPPPSTDAPPYDIAISKPDSRHPTFATKPSDFDRPPPSTVHRLRPSTAFDYPTFDSPARLPDLPTPRYSTANPTANPTVNSTANPAAIRPPYRPLTRPPYRPPTIFNASAPDATTSSANTTLASTSSPRPWLFDRARALGMESGASRGRAGTAVPVLAQTSSWSPG
ncbi:hypothetical protein C2E23DRAFT_888311 [Lenzites betulinus]|nr:hypothetical protein C2E23DRAFT_888311 [Lenzites betulinus]